MHPDDAPGREALGERRQHIFLPQLPQHEAARHARHVGEREVAENGGGQQQVRDCVPEHVVFTGQQAVDRDHAGHRAHDVVEPDIQPARPADPAERGIEQQQADQAQPEHRHGIAEQGQQADHLVLPAAAMGRGQHAHRHADHHADEQGRQRQFERRGEHLQQVLQHGVRGDDGIAEIAVHHLHQVAPVLDGQGQVEPDLGCVPAHRSRPRPCRRRWRAPDRSESPGR